MHRGPVDRLVSRCFLSDIQSRMVDLRDFPRAFVASCAMRNARRKESGLTGLLAALFLLFPNMSTCRLTALQPHLCRSGADPDYRIAEREGEVSIRG
jgi:hypothetical protein